jgi:hypothetical protein
MTALARFTAIGMTNLRKNRFQQWAQAITVVLMMRRCGGKAMALRFPDPLERNSASNLEQQEHLKAKNTEWQKQK